MFKKLLVFLTAGIFIARGYSSFAMSCGSGGSHDSHQQVMTADSGQQHNMAEESMPAMQKESVNIGNKICPVSGEKIPEVSGSGTPPATYEYEGKIYNFCCTACIEDFKKDPQKYIKKVEEELAAEQENKEKHDEQMVPKDELSGGSHRVMH